MPLSRLLNRSLVMLPKRYLDDCVWASQVTCVTGNTGVSYMLHNTGYRLLCNCSWLCVSIHLPAPTVRTIHVCVVDDDLPKAVMIRLTALCDMPRDWFV